MIPSLILLIIMNMNINYDFKCFNEISCSPLPAWSHLFANKQLMLRWMRNLDMLPCNLPGHFLNREIVDHQSFIKYSFYSLKSYFQLIHRNLEAFQYKSYLDCEHSVRDCVEYFHKDCVQFPQKEGKD